MNVTRETVYVVTMTETEARNLLDGLTALVVDAEDDVLPEVEDFTHGLRDATRDA